MRRTDDPYTEEGYDVDREGRYDADRDYRYDPDDDEIYEDRYEDRPRDVGHYEEDESWLEEGLIALLIVGGAALFLFPEPATSGLGIVLMAVGVVAWLIDWMM